MAELFNKVTIEARNSYTLPTKATEDCYGLWMIKETRVVGTSILFMSEPKNGIIISEINNTNNYISIKAFLNENTMKYCIQITNNSDIPREIQYKKIA